MNLHIAHGTLILICDGRRMMIMRNAGNAEHLKLTVEQSLEAPPNPKNAKQGDDRPGRLAGPYNPKSAIEGSDYHEQQEAHFAHLALDRLEKASLADPRQGLMIIAPPKALAHLRQAMPDDLKSRIIAEVDKDLTRHTVREIEKRLKELQ